MSKLTRLKRSRYHFDEDVVIKCCICGTSIKEKDNISFLVFFEGKDSDDLFDFNCYFQNEDDAHSVTCSACSQIDNLKEIGQKLWQRAKLLKAQHAKYNHLHTSAQQIEEMANRVFDLINKEDQEAVCK